MQIFLQTPWHFQETVKKCSVEVYTELDRGKNKTDKVINREDLVPLLKTGVRENWKALLTLQKLLQLNIIIVQAGTPRQKLVMSMSNTRWSYQTGVWDSQNEDRGMKCHFGTVWQKSAIPQNDGQFHFCQRLEIINIKYFSLPLLWNALITDFKYIFSLFPLPILVEICTIYLQVKFIRPKIN